MNPVAVRFERRRSVWRFAFGQGSGWLAAVSVLGLAGGIAALASVCLQASRVRAQVVHAEQRLANARTTPATQPARTLGARTTQEAVAWQQAVRSLNTPWTKLLDQLEATLPDDVALVSLEPSPGTGKLRLVAEARSLAQLLAYTTTLRQRTHFAEVTPLKHETQDQEPSRPARLTLELDPATSPRKTGP